jgi:hypothetical protein
MNIYKSFNRSLIKSFRSSILLACRRSLGTKSHPRTCRTASHLGLTNRNITRQNSNGIDSEYLSRMAWDNANTRIPPGSNDLHNDGQTLQVPGFGHPVDLELDIYKDKRFRHGVNDFRNDRLVVREIAMLALMDAITEKPRWHEKIFDETIVEKWRAEATAMPLISSMAWDWCVRELRDKTVSLSEYGFVKTLETGSACAKADGLIDDDLREELLAGVKPLLDFKESAKDWHPNSNDQVLNLVHPSLFPLVYGRTHVLQEGLVGLSDCVESCGKGLVTPEPTIEPRKGTGHGYRSEERSKDRFSTRFQWLPSEVKFKGEGLEVEFTSYINNLHPIKHKGLYSTISKVISKAIPMWDEVLVRSYHGRAPPRIITLVCMNY